MKEIPYKDFSLAIHTKNMCAEKMNSCQFELTFKCPLHCRHCYTDCYNKAEFTDKELDTESVKLVLDKLYTEGIIWLCFTGGDPLIRDDFPEIYDYAKRKGFIITLFTTLQSVTGEIADFLEKSPPFVIEVTINSVTEEKYEFISGVEGAYSSMLRGLDMLLKRALPLKVKTQLTKDNFQEKEEIKNFLEKKGIKFKPSFRLHARLDGDIFPCSLRISPDEVLSLQKNNIDAVDKINGQLEKCSKVKASADAGNNSLFDCVVGGGDGVRIDPFGNMFLCGLIRNPSVKVLETNIRDGYGLISKAFNNRIFQTNSNCKSCLIKESCFNCPGYAYLETGDMEASIPYFCELAHKIKSLQEVK